METSRDLSYLQVQIQACFHPSIVGHKAFERCVQKRLVHYFNPFLSKFLSAYRKSYRCESELLYLIEDWKGALDKNSVVGTVIMEVSKAFDLIPHDLLLVKLSAYGISVHNLN